MLQKFEVKIDKSCIVYFFTLFMEYLYFLKWTIIVINAHVLKNILEYEGHDFVSFDSSSL